MIQQWQLDHYQSAAREVCSRMGEHPDEQVSDDRGQPMPRWMVYAVRMHELRLMMSAMDAFGPYGPV